MHKVFYYTYIVASRTHALYIGMTNDIERRVTEHKEGKITWFLSTIPMQSTGMVRTIYLTGHSHRSRKAIEGVEAIEETHPDRTRKPDMDRLERGLG